MLVEILKDIVSSKVVGVRKEDLISSDRLIRQHVTEIISEEDETFDVLDMLISNKIDNLWTTHFEVVGFKDKYIIAFNDELTLTILYHMDEYDDLTFISFEF